MLESRHEQCGPPRHTIEGEAASRIVASTTASAASSATTEGATAPTAPPVAAAAPPMGGRVSTGGTDGSTCGFGGAVAACVRATSTASTALRIAVNRQRQSPTHGRGRRHRQARRSTDSHPRCPAARPRDGLIGPGEGCASVGVTRAARGARSCRAGATEPRRRGVGSASALG